MTEQIEIEESKSQSIQSDDDSGSDLGDGDVVEKVERRIYQPIEFDLNDPSNTFVIDFVSLQPDQQKPNTAANTVPAVPVPESGAVLPSEGASEGPKKKEPNPALFSNRMTSVIQRIESIYATAADLGYDSNDSFIDDEELFDEENDAAAEEEALYQGFYINKGELETKKRSREEHEESEEPAKKKRRVESGDTSNTTASPHKKSEDKEVKKKKKKSTGSTAAATTAEVSVKSDGANNKKKKKSGAGDADTKKKGSDTADKKSKKGDKTKTDSAAQIKTSPLLEEHIAQLSAAARQFVERHLAEQQQQPPTTATSTTPPTAPTAASPSTAPAKDGNKVVRFPRRLEPKLLLVAQDLQGLYPQLTFPDALIQRIAAPFAPVFKAESVRQRMLRLLQQHKPVQIDERTEMGQLLKIRQFLLKQFNERLQTLCDKLKRTVLPGEPQPRWTWSEDFKRKVGEIIELEKVIITLRASESESKKEPGKESKPVDMNKALKPVYGELSAMWPEGWITNQRIATAVKPRSNDALPTPKQVIAHYTPYLTGEKSDEVYPRPAVLTSTNNTSSTSNTNNPVAQVRSVPTPQTTQYAATQASVQGLPSGVSFNQLTGLGWSPSSLPMPNAAFPPYAYTPQMYNNNASNKPGEYQYYTPQ